ADGTQGVDARRAKEILGPWSDPLPCRTRGFFESPFVLFHQGCYYIFLPCVVWSSNDPLNFENTFLTVLTDEDGSQRAAIEVVQDKDGQHYIAGYGGPGGGIWLAKLNWRVPARQ
ncbi:MAG: hypothetical protein KJZ78_27025, partial [Bryobacteraceae bacterium]|nr:hypothetical protein [Bryobacteraceae bacterium]